MDKKKVVGAVLVGAAAVVYGVSPIDVIPELLGPVGLADDAAVILAAVGVMAKLLSRTKKPGKSEG